MAFCEDRGVAGSVRETAVACSTCGNKLRREWSRCPRCRTLRNHEAPSPVPNEPPARRIGLTGPLIALVAGVATAFVIALNQDSAPRASVRRESAAVESTAGAASAIATSPPSSEAKEVDAAALVARVASDTIRFGKLSLSQGDLDQAELAFETAVDMAPNDPEAHNQLGEVLVRRGRSRDAITHFNRAIEFDRDRWTFRLNRGRAFQLLGQWAAAVDDYRVAALGAPGNYETHLNLGRSLMQLRRYEDAANAFERAVRLSPRNTELLILLGNAYLGAQQPDLARGAFERFLELAPDDAEAPRVRALLDSQ
jgi:tetratricopeptide (TPR) repeat protein